MGHHIHFRKECHLQLLRQICIEKVNEIVATNWYEESKKHKCYRSGRQHSEEENNERYHGESEYDKLPDVFLKSVTHFGCAILGEADTLDALRRS